MVACSQRTAVCLLDESSCVGGDSAVQERLRTCLADEAALAILGEEERIPYGETLLSIITRQKQTVRHCLHGDDDERQR